MIDGGVVGMLLRWVLVLLITTAFAGPAAAAVPLPRSVLILDGTDTNSPWGLAFRSTIQSEISEGSKTPVAIYSEVLELGRFNSPRYQELLRTFLREKYRDKPIGTIVVHGALAFQILLRMRDELWPGVPVVFAFVDRQTLSQVSLPPDITGTMSQLTLRSVVAAAKALVPNLKRIALVGTRFDKDPFRLQFTQELSSLANEIEFIDLMDLPLGEVQKRVASLSEDTVVYYSNIYPVGQQTTLMLGDVVPLLARESNRPVLTDNEKFIGRGSVGGIVGIPELMAIESAKRALRLLDGEPASQMPIAALDFTRPVFDWRQMQRFSIDEDRLPPGSEIRFRSPSIWEQYRWQLIAISAAVILQAGVIFGLLFERRRRQTAEQESRKRFREVVHLNRTATAGALSASIAHELNQPLGAILCNAEAAEVLLARETPDLAQVKDILADIRRDDRRAGDVIRHLRGLLKRREIELQEFELGNTIQATLNILQPEAIRRGVSLKSAPLQGAVQVRADQVQLQQVILNLLTNGMDAMEACSPEKRILVVESVLVGNSEVEIAVLDTGPGIPGDRLDGIFETFFTTKPQGTGLGLSIARTIVETNGGKIWAENRAAGGAAFRFTLPLARAQAT